jgi:hypothetical protein
MSNMEVTAAVVTEEVTVAAIAVVSALVAAKVLET